MGKIDLWYGNLDQNVGGLIETLTEIIKNQPDKKSAYNLIKQWNSENGNIIQDLDIIYNSMEKSTRADKDLAEKQMAENIKNLPVFLINHGIKDKKTAEAIIKILSNEINEGKIYEQEKVGLLVTTLQKLHLHRDNKKELNEAELKEIIEYAIGEVEKKIRRIG